jgi:hypothetical protein
MFVLGISKTNFNHQMIRHILTGTCDLPAGTKLGWKTVFTKTYPINYQGDIITDVQAAYAEQERRNKEYFESKLEPYH